MIEKVNKKICIKQLKNWENVEVLSGDSAYNLWGVITGVTSVGEIIYYTGGTSSASVANFNILFLSEFDDMGVYNNAIKEWDGGVYLSGDTIMYNDISLKCKVSGSTENIFINNEWEYNVTDGEKTSVSYISDSKIDTFRRYSKSDDDRDLYNPTWNTGFTHLVTTQDNSINKLLAQRPNKYGKKQMLYDYVIGLDESDGSGIYYSDLEDGNSNISYETSGLTKDNSISAPILKSEYMLGVIEPIKVRGEINITRGNYNLYDKVLKLGDVRSVDDIEQYNNGFFKIKNN